MSTLSNDIEDEHDVVGEYKNTDSDEDQFNTSKNEDIGSDNEKSTARRIDPTSTKRSVVRNPIPKLNTERLKGPKGLHTIEKYFEGFKFYGKGYEKVDLDRIIKRMEHWGHRLFPKLNFDDFLEKLEKLGTKKDLQVFIKKYRLDMISADDMISQDNIDIEEDKDQDEPIDEFDLLIAEQIEKQKQAMSNASINNENTFNELLLQSNVTITSKPINTTSASPQLSDEVKERIERNRQLAVQRRLARFKEIEEAKRKKLEDTENTQPKNNLSNTEIPNATKNLENKECKSNSQVKSEDHES
ncbi:protein TIPIN homolog [Osmia bicornis bicornis]|uniref:protein TIPIN homolog n=1 Tax=Osmia bicornis bicornis TaxID=1437191 RepID=UPI0010F6C7BA|nr:protein TIPIN homolog [Osmia bicornis bicornis]